MSKVERFYYEIPNSAGDNIEVHWDKDGRVRGGGTLYISVEEPWAGSTETGFGYSTHVSIPAEAAIEMAKYILAQGPNREP